MEGAASSTPKIQAHRAVPDLAFPETNAVPSPRENIKLALKWPIGRFFDQSRSNGIVDYVFPFRIVIFVTPQLGIPRIALPNRMILPTRPS
jgi:hypothetical protein